LNELSKYYNVYVLVPNWNEKLRYLGTPKEILINEKEVKFKIIWHPVIFPTKSLINFYPKVIYSLIKLKPNLVVLNLYHSITGILVGIFCKLFRIPLVVISAFNPNIPYHLFERALLRFAYLIPDHIVVLTNKMKNKAINELKVNENKISIIPESGYNIVERKEINSNLTFLYAGRHVYEKGLHLLIFAFEKLSKKDKVKLVICGEGIITDILKRYIKIKGLENFIEFKGYVEENELKKIFSESDVFIYPSIRTKRWEEQFGYAVVEAMSHGLAVIVSDCGSLPEIVNDAGIIVKQNNIDDLAKAMEFVCDEKKLIELSKKSLKRAEDFSLEKVTKKWKELIERLAKK